MSRGRVMRPKTQIDRNLRRIAQIEIENAGPEAVRYVASVMRGDVEASTRDRLKASDLLLSRLIPTLQSMDVRALVAEFGLEPLRPARSDESLPAVTDEEKSRRESIALLRGAIALLESHGVERPGLVLLRRADAAAG